MISIHLLDDGDAALIDASINSYYWDGSAWIDIPKSRNSSYGLELTWWCGFGDKDRFQQFIFDLKKLETQKDIIVYWRYSTFPIIRACIFGKNKV